MSGFDGLRRVFRIAGVRRDVKTDVEEELDFHFQQTMDELEAQGLSRAAARAEARRRFGEALPPATERFLQELARTEQLYRNVASSDLEKCFMAMVEASRKIDEAALGSWEDLADEINYLDPETLTFASLTAAVNVADRTA